MGGVAGHAGVFSTAHDVGVYAQALLDRLAGRPSDFPLSKRPWQLMTSPQQPGHNDGQIEAANEAEREAGEEQNATDPLLAPHYPAIRGRTCAASVGISIRFSPSPRQGLSHRQLRPHRLHRDDVWIDPGSDTYVVLLTNSIHTRGSPPASKLRGDVATAAAQALGSSRSRQVLRFGLIGRCFSLRSR